MYSALASVSLTFSVSTFIAFFSLRPSSAQQNYALMYFVPRPPPRRRMMPPRTIAPRTASTVVGLTSGRIEQISDLDSGVNEFNTVASMRFSFPSPLSREG